MLKHKLYSGQVTHQRLTPVNHHFSYHLFMVYLNLKNPDSAFKNRLLWSLENINVASFKRKDHLGNPHNTLESEVRKLILDKYNFEPKGDICLLTQLRYFGFLMNPVSFYFCWNGTNDSVDFIVAEVTNTPWSERYCYVLDCRNQSDTFQFNLDKQFHVSPFLPMEQQYQWQFTINPQQIMIIMNNYEHEKLVFNACLDLKPKAMSSTNMAYILIRHPFMTLKVAAGIYYQAMKLWFKKVPFYPHPKHNTKP